MSFIAKGSEVILREGSGETSTTNYIYTKLTQSGAFEDISWGDNVADFDNARVLSTWSTYGAYKYINLGMYRKIYSDIHTFNRNTRFDTVVDLSNTSTPSSADLSCVSYIVAAVKGSQTDSVSTISQYVIDEFSVGEYDNVLAIGVLNRDIKDYRAINIDVNNVKTFAGSALSTKDYDLSTDEAIYLVVLAICTNADMEQFTSLSINLFKEIFIEFLGDNVVTPGSIGKTEMNPDYKAERAINNFIMTIDDAHIVDNTIILSPDYTTQIDNNSIYYLNFTGATVSANKLSLGYYDVESGEYVSSGTKYNVTISGSVAGKVAVAVIVNNAVTIKALV